MIERYLIGKKGTEDIGGGMMASSLPVIDGVVLSSIIDNCFLKNWPMVTEFCVFLLTFDESYLPQIEANASTYLWDEDSVGFAAFLDANGITDPNQVTALINAAEKL